MKSKKIILIYYIAYLTIKNSKYVKISSGNPLYFMLSKMNRCFEEINENKCLTLVPNNESKEKIKKYEELSIKIKDLIRSVTKKSETYDQNCIKIKFPNGHFTPN